MKIKLKNLGALKQAEFTLGDLTIICGGNNTGKTYATYALFGFLYGWQQIMPLEISPDQIEQLLNEGVIYINLEEYVNQAENILKKACDVYTQQLYKIFAAPPERFKETYFQILLDNFREILVWQEPFQQIIVTPTNAQLFSLTKSENSTKLAVTLLLEQETAKLFPQPIILDFAKNAIKEIIFGRIFPRSFIASAERTGAAIFRKELNFARNRLLEEISIAGNNINPMELLFRVYQDYPLPVKQNVDFTRDLETIFKKSSFLVENHPDVLADFADIIGGEYAVTRNDELYYIPKNVKMVKLSMDESSSAVRSLLDIGFYLRHEAQLGDLLMVDEPELNLHPENQRRMARLFARLVNLGIKVFITTHSDYIIKELNTLIMLNHDRPHLQRIAEAEGYRPEELIAAEKIKVYIAEKASIKLEGSKKKTQCYTLTPAEIDPEMGIAARSFDTTIETMNRIQEAIVWGES